MTSARLDAVRERWNYPSPPPWEDDGDKADVEYLLEIAEKADALLSAFREWGHSEGTSADVIAAIDAACVHELPLNPGETIHARVIYAALQSLTAALGAGEPGTPDG